MRRPSVAKAMNQEGEFPGLQAVLQGKVKISEAMTTVELEKCPGSLQILYGKRQKEVLQTCLRVSRWRDSFPF